MEKCPLCGQMTYETTKSGNKVCRYSKCGWKGKALSCDDVGDMGKLQKYIKDDEREKKYKELSALKLT